MEQEYKAFQKRFGSDVLANLQGEDLIEKIFNVSNRDSLAYWLEFKRAKPLKPVPTAA